jgi:CRAL/TRIO domain
MRHNLTNNNSRKYTVFHCITGRVARLVICNAPSWFHSVWSMVARVLPESVRKKVVIMHGVKGLDEFILPSNRPEEYGGSDVPLGHAPEHLQFLQLAKDWDTRRAERGERGAGSESGPQSGSGYSNKSPRNGSIQGRSRRDSEKESESGHRKKTSKKKKNKVGLPICMYAR